MATIDLRAWQDAPQEYLRIASVNNAYKERIDDPAFLALLGDVCGKRVLDIGCGAGLFCKKLRLKGALVTGVDVSPVMIREAWLHDPEGTYCLADISADLRVTDLWKSRWHLVTSKMMLMNVRSISAVARNVYQLLEDDGVFAVDIVHPARPFIRKANDGHYQGISDYFTEGCGAMRFGNQCYPYYHRPIGQYVRDITAAGFVLSDLQELGVDQSFAIQHPEHSQKVGQPVSLHMIFQRKKA